MTKCPDVASPEEGPILPRFHCGQPGCRSHDNSTARCVPPQLPWPDVCPRCGLIVFSTVNIDPDAAMSERPCVPPPPDAAPVAQPDFEAEAEAFSLATGYMCPGKDVPAAMNPSDDYMEKRQVAWRAWCAGRNYAYPKDAPPLEELGRLQCAECASKGVRRQPCIHISQVYDSGKRIGHIEARHGYDPEDAPGQFIEMGERIAELETRNAEMERDLDRLT